MVVANYEVYNEQLYDLLSAENDSRPDKQARKPRLKCVPLSPPRLRDTLALVLVSSA